MFGVFLIKTFGNACTSVDNTSSADITRYRAQCSVVSSVLFLQTFRVIQNLLNIDRIEKRNFFFLHFFDLERVLNTKLLSNHEVNKIKHLTNIDYEFWYIVTYAHSDLLIFFTTFFTRTIRYFIPMVVTLNGGNKILFAEFVKKCKKYIHSNGAFSKTLGTTGNF